VGLSHDARRIALGGVGMWIYDRDRKVATRVRAETMPGQGIREPAWSPGDSLIAYGTAFRGPLMLRVYHVRGGTSDSLFSSTRRLIWSPDWSPDGRLIAFQFSAGGESPRDEIWVYSFAERRATRAWEAVGNNTVPRWSPDGRWLAYVSDEAGEPDVYVRPASGRGVAVRVSTAGGEFPRWRDDGRELYYRAPNRAIMVVGMQLGRMAAVSPPRPVVAGLPFSRTVRGFEATPDGQQFVAFGRGDPPVLTLLLDWASRLRPR
jgi:eukaryotic-like serine/threonine-protein kinase